MVYGDHLSYSLESRLLKDCELADYKREYYRITKGDSRSLDYTHSRQLTFLHCPYQGFLCKKLRVFPKKGGGGLFLRGGGGGGFMV